MYNKSSKQHLSSLILTFAGEYEGEVRLGWVTAAALKRAQIAAQKVTNSA